MTPSPPETALDLKEELEDAIDCAGAAREDHELVVVSVGSIRAALAEIEGLRQALTSIAGQPHEGGEHCFDAESQRWRPIRDVARQALNPTPEGEKP